MSVVSDPFGLARASADLLAARTGVERHDVALVLGSGWTPAADSLGEIVADIPLVELGGFPESTVAGHGSSVRSIRAGGKRILRNRRLCPGRDRNIDDVDLRVVEDLGDRCSNLRDAVLLRRPLGARAPVVAGGRVHGTDRGGA